MLNSSSTSCFYHGLTDLHKDSWMAYFLHVQPFSGEVYKSGSINKVQMTSTALLSQHKLLMPFEDNMYNSTWGSVNPSLDQAFPHDKTSTAGFFNHKKSSAQNAGNKGYNSNNGLKDIGAALTSLVDLKMNPNSSLSTKQQPPKHITFQRIFGNRADFRFTAAINDIGATLGSFLLKESLSEKFQSFWDLDGLDPLAKDKDWETQLRVKLVDARGFYVFTWEDAKKNTISEMVCDEFISQPLECIIELVAKTKTGKFFFDPT